MTDFNPLAGAILGSSQAQELSDLQKQRQLRRAQTLRKNVAARDDEREHQVESSEEVSAVNDRPNGQSRQQDKRDPRDGEDKDDGRPHLDVKA